MRISYSQHLKNRLSLRKIEYDLPEIIYKQSNERYFDEKTGHLIATTKLKLYDKFRDIMIAYIIEENCANLLTIHPLKEGQKENRIKTGRWRKI